MTVATLQENTAAKNNTNRCRRRSSESGKKDTCCSACLWWHARVSQDVIAAKSPAVTTSIEMTRATYMNMRTICHQAPALSQSVNYLLRNKCHDDREEHKCDKNQNKHPRLLRHPASERWWWAVGSSAIVGIDGAHHRRCSKRRGGTERTSQRYTGTRVVFCMPNCVHADLVIRLGCKTRNPISPIWASIYLQRQFPNGLMTTTINNKQQQQ